uniref:recombinase family protein n=1 Tax=Candidatus Fimenecus sp. TaxID=3022888 RepID=UPI003FEF569A
MLKYATDNGFPNPTFLIDDGVSGVTFDRPGWNEMIGLSEAGKVKTVIIKDYCAIIGLNQKDLENQGILA